MDRAHRKLSDIDSVVVHCSDSAFGDSKLIDEWHRERGWSGCGYHAIVLNGKRAGGTGAPINEVEVGMVETDLVGGFCRKPDEVGAHCPGLNQISLGICYIGNQHRFDMDKRVLTALIKHVAYWCALYKINTERIFYHCMFNKQKTCPALDMSVQEFRQAVRNEMGV